MQCADQDEKVKGDDVSTVFTVGGNHIHPSSAVKILVNGTPLTMELDMKAAVSLVSESV